MIYYAHYNQTTNMIEGWYNDEVHEIIPTPNVEISFDNWQTAITQHHNKIDLSTGNSFFEYQEPILTTAERLLKERKEFTNERHKLVSEIIVQVNDKEFNGDEESQTRMARAILAADIVNRDTVNWTLANNESIEVTLEELKMALVKSLEEMADLWVQP